MIIRIAEITDLKAIVDIYNQSIPSQRSTGHTKALKSDDQIDWFNKHSPDKYPIYVSEINHEIIGWCSLSPYREGRFAFQYTAEISYYIDQNHHRKGIATKLLNYSIEQCKRLKLTNLVAFLMEHNTASVQLLEKHGFTKWGLLPNVVNFNEKKYNHVIYGRDFT